MADGIPVSCNDNKELSVNEKLVTKTRIMIPPTTKAKNTATIGATIPMRVLCKKIRRILCFSVTTQYPPVIISPRLDSVASSGSIMPTIFPSYITAILSEIERISSRSAEISNTAFPASRACNRRS